MGSLKIITYAVLAVLMCWVAKKLIRFIDRGVDSDSEITGKDNPAYAVTTGGYYLAVMIVMGGPLSGPQLYGFWLEILLIIAWGLAGLVGLVLAQIVSRKLVFRGINMTEETTGKQNIAAGIISAGMYIANAMVLLGVLSGEGGGILSALVFWAAAQLLLMVSFRIFMRADKCGIKDVVISGNTAAALILAGEMTAVGNVIRVSVDGNFEGWAVGLGNLVYVWGLGLVLLFLIRFLADLVLLPGATVRNEIFCQKKPNMGLGAMLGLMYVGLSVIVVWCL